MTASPIKHYSARRNIFPDQQKGSSLISQGKEAEENQPADQGCAILLISDNKRFFYFEHLNILSTFLLHTTQDFCIIMLRSLISDKMVIIIWYCWPRNKLKLNWHLYNNSQLHHPRQTQKKMKRFLSQQSTDIAHLRCWLSRASVRELQCQCVPHSKPDECGLRTRVECDAGYRRTEPCGLPCVWTPRTSCYPSQGFGTVPEPPTQWGTIRGYCKSQERYLYSQGNTPPWRMPCARVSRRWKSCGQSSPRPMLWVVQDPGQQGNGMERCTARQENREKQDKPVFEKCEKKSSWWLWEHHWQYISESKPR